MAYMGRAFNYEWYTVDIVFANGRCSTEFKARSRESVIRQINRYVSDCNSDEKQSLDIWHRPQRVVSVDWDSLRLDRIGHQR